MKIGIYAIGVKPTTQGGVEIYFRNLIQSLSEFDKENKYYVFLDNKNLKRAIQQYSSSNLELIYFPELFSYIALALKVLFRQPKSFFKLLANKFYKYIFSKNIFAVEPTGVYGKIIDFLFKMDVIHFPFHTIDPSFFDIKTPIVLTVHDIQQEYYPEFFDAETLYQRMKSYKPSAERADIIITLSENTKRTLVEKYGIESEKIIVTYQGCGGDFKRIDTPEVLNAVREKYSLPAKFIFYPAATWPHKNHIKLFEAIATLKEKYSFEEKLCLTGIPKENHRRVMDTVKKFNLDNKVNFLYFVPFSYMPVIYNLATIMVFPSLFEGFGIPLLEAMQVGLPIACSDRTSVPEIVGDAGIYFNPGSTEDIAEKIYQLWNDDDLKEKLILKGFERAKKFTWQQVIEKTVAAYKRALGSLYDSHGY
jgi:glycosyltransferase involved in cell wall biosynthesis